MVKLRLLPYKAGSKSCKAVAQALNALRVRMEGTFRPGPRYLVINWGAAQRPRWWTKGLNDPVNVGRSSNKKTALSYLRQGGVTTPEFTDDVNIAKAWYNEGAVVVGRAVLNGHSGIGCRIFYKKEKPEEPSGCPLYTKHLRHKREFRVHVFNGKIIDFVEKKRKNGIEERDAWIRNHDKGYVFARQGVQLPPDAAAESLKAVVALGLDFGAVDIGYREKEEKAFVFEVNTAPGLEGQTIQSYARAIKELQNAL